jgi:hypothetical protein
VANDELMTVLRAIQIGDEAGELHEMERITINVVW